MNDLLTNVTNVAEGLLRRGETDSHLVNNLKTLNSSVIDHVQRNEIAKRFYRRIINNLRRK